MGDSNHIILDSPELPLALYHELVGAVKGDVYLRNDLNFVDYSRMFNGDVKTAAKAVVCPIDAQDVSRLVLFCTKHSLFPSVKAGGYGTAGWAVGGDIIVDLSKIVDISIEPPLADGAYTSIRDMPAMDSKGKARAGPPVAAGASSGKRRREDDARLRVYASASRGVENFLHFSGPMERNGDRSPPSTRRKLDLSVPSSEGPQVSTNSSGSSRSSDPISSTSDGSGSSLFPGASTSSTSPSPFSGPSSNVCGIDSTPLASSDPFGYLEDQPSSGASTSFRHQRFAPGALFASPGFLDSPHNILSHATPVHSHAFLTFGAGMRQKEIDMFSAENPLGAISLGGSIGAVPYHVPFAAHPVGSAIMILGGFGFLGRLHGLSVDNLVEAEVVLADGSIVYANQHEYSDLWWALRGGGPAFGIVTRYKARAYPVPVVFAGNLIYRFHRATAPSLIKHFRDCVKGAPNELYANVLLTAGPAGQDSLVVIQMCYVGPKVKGQEFLQAISSWDGEQCLLNEIDEKSFLHQQDSVAQVLRGKAGNKWFIRSALISSLPDEIVNRTVLQFADTPVGCTWLFELAGGALTDYEDGCLPKEQRQASFTVAALHQWDINFDDPKCIHSAEEWIAETLAPVTVGGPLPSFLGRHEPPGRVMACYGRNWNRLCEVKKKYDPLNIFRNSFWPLNADGEAVEPEEHEPEHIVF
ncbi:hypothetical protein BJ138DRAFT_1171783 [Hygrophoropsis aurantiaca]|uniref:Uncharacterized protein n=1 Tax=Hygrophoropsis aurantiaca TaxID=72124 RepID=A0ACB8AIE4_9AGAM|nr:hypothetical protein BJ138DRAFT_1171783 [Hygrophoropsis aurantiaca]